MRRALLTAAALSATALLALSGCAAAPSFTGSWAGEGDNAPELEITEDWAFTGSDGCNTMVGSGTVDGDTFDFGRFATTRKYCEGVDTWLSLAGSATVQGDTLTVLDLDGAELGTLTRAKG
ncbi:META domain-containing protein [Leucobacter sp. PH1c]|uniref:META domain-containing protein n=1 Tax=Leucobacter sp. PH1c TaxID=1397278 RepID=UPI0004A7E6FB|nr:META domain-containing protein [Leucobacter sp. PH1c]